MFVSGGLIARKKEMTSLLVDGKMIAVTILSVLPQKVVRAKTKAKDGYNAFVVGVYNARNVCIKQKEFNVSEDVISDESVLGLDTYVDGMLLSAQSTSKGKGFQGMIKREHAKGMPATHGHKFTRTGGSKGNRKPRRVLKGHPHAGHMGDETVTIKKIPLIKKMTFKDETLFVVKGSIPGSYNQYITLYK